MLAICLTVLILAAPLVSQAAPALTDRGAAQHRTGVARLLAKPGVRFGSLGLALLPREAGLVE
jgi:hypothetical protein